MNKIAFFSESQIVGKIQRTFVNARTEYAWMMALDAPHYPINNISATELDFDLGIVIIPKTKIDELMKVDLIKQMNLQPNNIPDLDNISLISGDTDKKGGITLNL